MQRYEIVNGVIEVEGAANETTDESEEDKGSEYRNGTLFLCCFNLLI